MLILAPNERLGKSERAIQPVYNWDGPMGDVSSTCTWTVVNLALNRFRMKQNQDQDRQDGQDGS